MIFSDKRFFCKWMITILVIGFVMRAVLGYLSEYNNDVTAWTMTLSNIESGSGLYNEAGYYYPPVWGYILGTFSGFLGLFGVDSWADIFTDLLFVEDYEDAMVSTPAFNIALTVLLTIADLISSYAIYWIVMHLTGDMIKAKMGFSIYFILPHMIFQTAGYGQFDPISAMMTLLCVCLLLRGDDFLAGMMFVLAVLLKFFPVFLFFIFNFYHSSSFKIA